MRKNYTLYERPRGTRIWTRATTLEAPKPQAVRLFQNLLIARALDQDVEAELRPVREAATS